MKLCKDCKHFNPDAVMVRAARALPECGHSGNQEPDYVNGGLKANYSTAQGVRMNPDMCGTTAKWFEPQEGA